MKLVKGLLVAGLAVAVLAGCGAKEEATPTQGAAAEQTDAVTTASIVNEAGALVNALSDKGTWIVAILNDVTVDQEIVVAGEFHKKNDPANEIYRKLALYSQDADKNITAQFTMTVPKVTVQSEGFSVQNGTIKGDVFVEANGFNLNPKATIDGNLYFASEDVKATAKIEGTVTGATEVK